jgi:hypothetical protein
MTRYTVALSVGGIQGQPDIEYQEYHTIIAESPKEAVEIYNSKYSAYYFTGKVIECIGKTILPKTDPTPIDTVKEAQKQEYLNPDPNSPQQIAIRENYEQYEKKEKEKADRLAKNNHNEYRVKCKIKSVNYTFKGELTTVDIIEAGSKDEAIELFQEQHNPQLQMSFEVEKIEKED